MILMAQAVPGATRLPCVASMPIGWQYLGGDFRTGRASFWFGLRSVRDAVPDRRPSAAVRRVAARRRFP